MTPDGRASPLVSVIMAAYNSEAHIRDALETVVAQDWSPLEVVVVDDGSQDATPEIIQSFPSVRYIRQDNAGPSAARNAALAAAQGELIAVFDSDDLMATGRLRAQAEYLVSNPEVGAVLGRQEWINPPEWLPRDAVYGDLDGIPVGGAAMFRAGVIRELGGYDTSFTHGEDTDLLIRMRERGIPYVVLPEVVLHRRFREGSLTAQQPDQTSLLKSLRAKLGRDQVDAEAEGP
jgi:glycosyltransferase involved in cell wall biosynthesis